MGKKRRTQSGQFRTLKFNKNEYSSKFFFPYEILLFGAQGVNETGETQEEDEEDDREVMKNFYRVKGASIISEARNLADQRKNDEAKKILQNFKEELQGSDLRREEFIKNLIKDIERASGDVNPIVYERSGKHNMVESSRAQMLQKTNLKSTNSYRNSVQMSMLTEVRTMKSKK